MGEPTGLWDVNSGTLTVTVQRLLRDAVEYTFSVTLTNPSAPQVSSTEVPVAHPFLRLIYAS